MKGVYVIQMHPSVTTEYKIGSTARGRNILSDYIRGNPRAAIKSFIECENHTWAELHILDYFKSKRIPHTSGGLSEVVEAPLDEILPVVTAVAGGFPFYRFITGVTPDDAQKYLSKYKIIITNRTQETGYVINGDNIITLGGSNSFNPTLAEWIRQQLRRGCTKCGRANHAPGSKCAGTVVDIRADIGEIAAHFAQIYHIPRKNIACYGAFMYYISDGAIGYTLHPNRTGLVKLSDQVTIVETLAQAQLRQSHDEYIPIGAKCDTITHVLKTYLGTFYSTACDICKLSLNGSDGFAEEFCGGDPSFADFWLELSKKFYCHNGALCIKISNSEMINSAKTSILDLTTMPDFMSYNRIIDNVLRVRMRVVVLSPLPRHNLIAAASICATHLQDHPSLHSAASKCVKIEKLADFIGGSAEIRQQMQPFAREILAYYLSVGGPLCGEFVPWVASLFNPSIFVM